NHLDGIVRITIGGNRPETAREPARIVPDWNDERRRDSVADHLPEAAQRANPGCVPIDSPAASSIPGASCTANRYRALLMPPRCQYITLYCAAKNEPPTA